MVIMEDSKESFMLEDQEVSFDVPPDKNFTINQFTMDSDEKKVSYAINC